MDAREAVHQGTVTVGISQLRICPSQTICLLLEWHRQAVNAFTWHRSIQQRLSALSQLLIYLSSQIQSQRSNKLSLSNLSPSLRLKLASASFTSRIWSPSRALPPLSISSHWQPQQALINTRTTQHQLQNLKIIQTTSFSSLNSKRLLHQFSKNKMRLKRVRHKSWWSQR